MHKLIKGFELQFFAEGVEAESAETRPTDVNAVDVEPQAGVNAAAAGQQQAGVTTADAGQRLEELGVPKDKAERYRARKIAKQAQAEVAVTTQAAAVPEEQSKAPQDTQSAESNTPKQYNWDEIRNDPEINRQISELVRQRVKGYKQQQNEVTPILEVLGKKYGLDTSDPKKLDLKALSERVRDDSYFYEEYSEKLGVDIETAKSSMKKELDQSARERALNEREEQLNTTIEQLAVRRHIEKMHADAAELKKLFPDFDLQTELKNKKFAAMVSPSGGLSVADAFYALHHREIESARANVVAQAYANSIRSGRSIPPEIGTRTSSGGGIEGKLYSQMNPSERAEYKKQLQRTGKK